MTLSLPLTTPEQAQRYRAQGLWTDRTLAELFFEQARQHADKPAIVEQTRTLTYAQLGEQVTALAGHLLALGLKSGEIVAVQSGNAAELAMVNLACNRVGLVFMPLHESWRQAEVKHLLQLAKVSVLIVPGMYRGFDHVAMVKSIQPGLPTLAHVFAVDGAHDGARAFAELLVPGAASDEALRARRPDPDMPCNIMLSGGTTSLSKISRFTSNNMVVILRNAADLNGLTHRDVAAAIAPAGTGATGYIWGMLMPLIYGATTVILARWSDPLEAIELIVRHGCSYAVTVPTQLTMMIPGLEARPSEDFKHFRFCFSAGSSLPYDTGLKTETLMGCAIQVAYGTTDGGVPTMTSVDDPQDLRLRSVGRVLPGFDCEVRDAALRTLPQGESGEVVWRGPDKSWGYLGPDEQMRAAFLPDGFHRSGDLGCFDAQGYLHIVGRVKDMILRGGRNIFPLTIEEQLIKHPSVLDVAVAAMPDPVLGERACAFVVLREGKALAFDEMVTFLKQQDLAVWQLPERLECLPDLPRGVGGKVTKAKLSAMVAAKLQAEAAATTSKA